MQFPFSPGYFLLIIILMSFLLGIMQLGMITVAFGKLGMSPETGLLLLMSSLIGSLFNLPLFKLTAEQPLEQRLSTPWHGLLRLPSIPFTGKTIVAVNIGGCLIPVMFSLYLLSLGKLSYWQIVSATVFVSTVSYISSRPIPNLGIGMPILMGPLAAASGALLIAPEHSAMLAYVSGTLGVLIGADILRLKDIRQLGAPIASIGGAGTFDGIFITGIIAAFLA